MSMSVNYEPNYHSSNQMNQYQQTPIEYLENQYLPYQQQENNRFNTIEHYENKQQPRNDLQHFEFQISNSQDNLNNFSSLQHDIPYSNNSISNKQCHDTENNSQDIQNQLRNSLRDMYLRNINFNLHKKQAEKQKQIQEERDSIAKMNEVRLSQDQKNKEEKLKMQKLLFNDYIHANRLENFYNKPYNNEIGYSNTQGSPNTLNKEVFNSSGFRFRQSQIPKKQNENNLSNKISRDYYKENQNLFQDNQQHYFKTLNKEDSGMNRMGKKMSNFVDMGMYYNEDVFKKASYRDREKEKMYKIIESYETKKETCHHHHHQQQQPNKIKEVTKSPYDGFKHHHNRLAHSCVLTKNETSKNTDFISANQWNSTLKQNPILNPTNFIDERRYKNYLRFISQK